ncbi:PqqD family protein [Dysgonomonas sp. Marseille-P4677]|uniref:PqqD family protein n=1 Tax=Dysgonomonas sp. Marseille-P4677 TaxID=2364790 RepID=UPI0019127F08|nr:PqqD family protein [Dysgonomonas sp. Marseille-P4677]MBK5721501.1 PqqD family protein [Dysgonomonas sp. Marseille-P4677]
MRIRKGFKVQFVGGENIILLQGTYGVDTTKIVSFNDTSLLLWRIYENKEFTSEEIAETLVDEFDIEKELAIKDAVNWIDILIRNRLIEQ